MVRIAPAGQIVEFKVVIDLRGKKPEEYDELVIKCLRHAADKMESGTPFGGFADFDRTGGGFAYKRGRR